MISSDEYTFLKSLLKSPEIDEIKYSSEILSCLKSNFITHNVVKESYNQIFYRGFLLTPFGKRAIEEYEAFLLSQKNVSESLTLAKEANNLSKEANRISNDANKLAKEANNKADEANIISGKSGKKSNLSLWFSFGSMLAAIVSAVVAVIALIK